jgi:hypothetical protein
VVVDGYHGMIKKITVVNAGRANRRVSVVSHREVIDDLSMVGNSQSNYT